LQARRARSDAPYRAGLAAGLFDFIAHFGVRVERGVERPRPAGLETCAPKLGLPTADWKAGTTLVGDGFSGFTLKYRG